YINAYYINAYYINAYYINAYYINAYYIVPYRRTTIHSIPGVAQRTLSLPEFFV
ncbi:MAG: hypothetical protein ACI9G1_005682, partial [Pirellulaceae bacterium]